MSKKCKEVGTTFVSCRLIRIILYYLVCALLGTVIPTPLFNLFQLFFYTCIIIYNNIMKVIGRLESF